MNSFVLFNILLKAGIIGDRTSHRSHINLIHSPGLHSSILHHKILPDPQESPMEQQGFRKNTPTHLNKQIHTIIPQSHCWSSKNQGKRDLKESSVPKKGHYGDSSEILSNHCFSFVSGKITGIFGAVLPWRRSIHFILTSCRIPKWE